MLDIFACLARARTDAELRGFYQAREATLQQTDSDLRGGPLQRLEAKISTRCTMAGRVEAEHVAEAQPLDALVLTPQGFGRMGDVRVGDRLASIDGRENIVLAIHPQGSKQVYRVTFSDGSSTECCADHLWRIHYTGWQELWRIVDTRKVMQMLAMDRYRNRLSVEVSRGSLVRRSRYRSTPIFSGTYSGIAASRSRPRPP